MSTTMNRQCTRWLSFTALAACAATVLAADGKPSVPDGWTTSAPREEIRPKFSYDVDGGRDGKGGFVIAADQREGLDGWWTKTVPVKGGKHYRFHAARRLTAWRLPRQSAVVRIVWQDDRGHSVLCDVPTVTGYLKGWKPTAEPEYPTDKQTDATGLDGSLRHVPRAVEGDSRDDRASSAMGAAGRPNRMERSLAGGDRSTRGPQGATGRCSFQTEWQISRIQSPRRLPR